MSDPNAANRATAGMVLRALRKTRQVRQFTPEPVAEADLQALLEVARWSGSSIRTIISLGHPTEAAGQPRSAPGTARRPLSEVVQER